MSSFPTHGNTFLVQSNPLEGWRYPMEIPNEYVHLVPPDDDEMDVGTENNAATFDKNVNRHDLQVAIAELIHHQGEPYVAQSTVGVVDEQPDAEDEWRNLFASAEPLNESVSFVPSTASVSQSNRKRSRSDCYLRREEAHQKDVLLGRGINYSGNQIRGGSVSTRSFEYGAYTEQNQTLIANEIYERAANTGRHFIENPRESGHRHCAESYRHEARDKMSCNFQDERRKRQRRKDVSIFI